MDKRTAIADASPLIGLATAGCFEVLRDLYATVIVTHAVKDEIEAGGRRAGAAELDAALRAGWIRAAPTPMETWRLAELDTGEASVLALARPGHIVLMDDAAGRAEAEARGIEVQDTAAVLLAAKHAGLIERISPCFRRLAQKGFVVPEAAVAAALALAGES